MKTKRKTALKKRLKDMEFFSGSQEKRTSEDFHEAEKFAEKVVNRH